MSDPRWSRRAVLTGATAAIALPWLPSLLPANADGATPARLMFWYVPNGMHMPAWAPTARGEGWAPSALLAPLSDLTSQVSVLTGLQNLAAEELKTGAHCRGTASFLSVQRAHPGVVRCGESVDQVAARMLPRGARFPSLSAQLSDPIGVCEPDYACVYNQTVSWRDERSPLPNITTPSMLFDLMFNRAATPLSARQRDRKRSVLDEVVAQASDLQPSLSAEDRPRLEAFLTSVREVELRLTTEDARSCTIPERPSGVTDVDDAMAAYVDLLVIALQCDLSRVLTFMSGVGGSQRVYRNLGLSESHHELSHHMQRPEAYDALTKIGTWEVAWFSTLVRALASTPEGDGSLLDRCLIAFGSEIADGNDHTLRDLPFLLAGSGSGAVRPGRLLSYPGQSTASLYLSMLHAVGLPVDRFGMDGDATLDGLITGAG